MFLARNPYILAGACCLAAGQMLVCVTAPPNVFRVQKGRLVTMIFCPPHTQEQMAKTKQSPAESAAQAAPQGGCASAAAHHLFTCPTATGRGNLTVRKQAPMVKMRWATLVAGLFLSQAMGASALCYLMDADSV